MCFRRLYSTPVITEADYLHDVDEIPATLSELGFKGSVIATRRDTLTLYTAKEEATFYTSPWRIKDLAGPNKKGHLVVFEINQTTNEYRFVLLDFNAGTARVVHEGVGDVIWKSVVGEMAMHPAEDKLVYFTGTGNRQYPGAYMRIGKLVKLDLSTRSQSEIATDVVESKLSFSGDGASLFFCRSTEDAEPQITQLLDRTKVQKSWGRGWSCSLSFDSASMIVYGRDNTPDRAINLKSGESEPAQRAQYYFIPLASLSKSLMLAGSLPLSRETARYFPPTGSISGPHRMMRLGVFEPKSKRAAILRSDLNRYEPVAYSDRMLTAKAFNRKP